VVYHEIETGDQISDSKEVRLTSVDSQIRIYQLSFVAIVIND